MTNRYQKGLIYKIVCKNPDVTDFYVGSTCNLKKRKSQHKGKYGNDNYCYPLYKCMKDNGGWDNFDMVLIEYFPCETKLELQKREREIIEQLKPTLNYQIPTRTTKEYQEENKDYLKEKHKQYYENHKEELKLKGKEWLEKNKEKYQEYKSKWYEENKEKLHQQKKEYREKNTDKIKERQHQYSVTHKDEKKEYDKQYREKNKEKLLAKVICEICGKEISKRHLVKHTETRHSEKK